jgi:hypothetical protein
MNYTITTDNTGGDGWAYAEIVSTPCATTTFWSNVIWNAKDLTNPKEGWMKIYFVALVDAYKNQIIRFEFGIGKSEAIAASRLKLTDAENDAINAGDMVLIAEEIASYEPIKVTRTKSV